MQAGRQYLVDAPVLEFGAQLAGTALGFAVGVTGHHGEVAHHLVQAGVQGARHVRAQDQQLGDTLRLDHVSVDLAVDLEARDAAQDRAPMVEVVLLVLFAGGAEEVALDRMELHVDQARRVVGPLQEGAQAHEIQGFVHQHGADRDAARQVRAELDPLEELPGVALELAGLDHAAHLQPGLVLGFPDLGGQRTPHGAGVLAGRAQAGHDARRVAFVLDHEIHHVAGPDLAIPAGVVGQQLADADQALPPDQGHRLGLRQQRGLVVHVQQPGGVFGAFCVAGHPEQVVGGTAQHARSLGDGGGLWLILPAPRCPWCLRLATN